MEVKDGKIVLFWDRSLVKFGFIPEPLEDFSVAVLYDNKMILHLGDLSKLKKFTRRLTRVLLQMQDSSPRRRMCLWKEIHSTKAQFCDNGQFHEVAIECDTVGLKDPRLEISIDRKRVMQVKRLAWKFGGNQTILVDGLPIEVFWDVHSWFFGAPSTSAVFMFQTCLSYEKLWPWSRGLGFLLTLHAWRNE